MPTPVSALIHAATLVTAGVYLMLRSAPMLEYAPTALVVIAWLGATTAFFAATCGLVSNDAKRIIAFSTCSQLGYMFMAVGLAQYSAGLFHLVTHAYALCALKIKTNCWYAKLQVKKLNKEAGKSYQQAKILASTTNLEY